MTKKSKKRLIVLLLALLVIAIIIFCVAIPFYKKAKAPTRENSAIDRASNSNMTSDNATTNGNTASSFDQKDNSVSNTGPVEAQNSNASPSDTSGNTSATSAEQYYNLGLTYTNEKKYDLAISSFAKAIEVNSNVSDYYSKKAEAEILAGDKAAAISTVESGLRAIPGDELLQNKLDIIRATVK